MITSFTASSLYSGVNPRRCPPMMDILSCEVSTARGQGHWGRRVARRSSRQSAACCASSCSPTPTGCPPQASIIDVIRLPPGWRLAGRSACERSTSRSWRAACQLVRARAFRSRMPLNPTVVAITAFDHGHNEWESRTSIGSQHGIQLMQPARSSPPTPGRAATLRTADRAASPGPRPARGRAARVHAGPGSAHGSGEDQPALAGQDAGPAAERR